MKIANRIIDTNHAPLVIAEIGINHGGDLNVAKAMVDAAKNAGCEIIKHQTHFVEDEMTEEAKHVFPANASKSIWDVISACALTAKEEIELIKYTESQNLIYISTPFSRKAADFLNDMDVPAFKIGSGECNHLPLIEHISRFGKPIIMSTGMQNIETIKKSVQILEKARIEYALLECTNVYPSSPETISLRGIAELKQAFPNGISGFSDHSIGPAMALASVALGACIIEKHFTDSRYRKGPDIICSMDPCELKLIIERSAEIHRALSNKKERCSAEETTYKFARGSVIAERDLAKGHVLTTADIWAKRPGSGEIPVDDFYTLVGMRTTRNILQNKQLQWKDVEKCQEAT